MFRWQCFPLELICWTTGLILLSQYEAALQHHFSLCPLYNLGVSWCPGCGLGRSIASFLHGDVSDSIKHHWFGIPGLFILLYRVFYLLRNFRLTLMLTNP
ncbi:MAG TPA: DUF2752 domain-containing protein [Sphingobacteriaceae bacterium]